ncbi:MAG: hypothetical protein KHX58_03855 [Coprobacillus sp.]|nr:hypothetical protein [Coprobacillus sp.]
MARKYDIIERLKAKNERPFVTVDEDHSYQINTSKTNVMAIMTLTDEVSKKENATEEDSMEMMDKIIEMSLGKEGAEYITSLDLTFDAYSLIFDVIMAAIKGVDLEEDSNEKETPKK